MLRKFNFHENRTQVNDTSHEDQYTFLSYDVNLLIEYKMFQKNIVDEI
jgi:hypothetical protein